MNPENRRSDRHVRFAANLILAYKGSEPFHLYLKRYFRQHKRHGSNDRRAITAFCYQYFRLGHGIIKPMSVEDKIWLGHELAGGDAPLDTLLEKEAHRFDVQKIFPFTDQLSKDIDQKHFNNSFLLQPLLFLRIRPGHTASVNRTLQENNIPYEPLSDNAIALPNATGIENILDVNREVVVQDLSSQHTAWFLKDFDAQKGIHVWDACAASGGKSILTKDLLPDCHLTVSDKRKSILTNLKKRFAQAALEANEIFQADLSKPLAKRLRQEPFDLIIVDAPCSGSGTWSRTPEQLHFFDETQVEAYATLQLEILTNSLPKLKTDGYLLYLTCSVFARENEENVRRFCKTNALKLVAEKYFRGYDKRADTLYGAMMKR